MFKHILFPKSIFSIAASLFSLLPPSPPKKGLQVYFFVRIRSGSESSRLFDFVMMGQGCVFLVPFYFGKIQLCGEIIKKSYAYSARSEQHKNPSGKYQEIMQDLSIRYANNQGVFLDSKPWVFHRSHLGYHRFRLSGQPSGTPSLSPLPFPFILSPNTILERDQFLS